MALAIKSYQFVCKFYKMKIWLSFSGIIFRFDSTYQGQKNGMCTELEYSDSEYYMMSCFDVGKVADIIIICIFNCFKKKIFLRQRSLKKNKMRHLIILLLTACKGTLFTCFPVKKIQHHLIVSEVYV